MRITESFTAWGHENIRATHKTTFEITKENHLTKRGDCIVAVRASKGAHDLDPKFKKLARNREARITVIIEAKGIKEIAVGYGSPMLTFEHPTDLVARKSEYICGRTVMVKSDKAACDFSPELIRILRDSQRKIKITLMVQV